MKRLLFVVRNQADAEAMRPVLRPEDHVTPVFGTTMGRQFDHVVMLMTPENAKEQDWIDCAIRTRIVPGGELL